MEDCIIEGFICPICMVDLGSPTKLSSHFEELHPDDKELYQQFKSFFSKAKQKILKQSDGQSNSKDSGPSLRVASRGTPYSGGIDLLLWQKQTIGCTRSHIEYFRCKRKEAIEKCVVESNKIKIRLEKLIRSGIYASDSSLPRASKARKNFEKSVVPWENDQNVKECRKCHKKFSMTYRRHHCRLCGDVVCERCLDKLDMVMACGVLKLDTQTASSFVKFTMAESENENSLKVCDTCNTLLEREIKLIHDKSANTQLLQLYGNLQASMREADSIQPKYMKIANSLNDGEREFGMEAASEMRLKLLKSYESVEALSKRIQQLGLDKEKQPSLQLLKLQRSIRAYASSYLTENMFVLPALPSAEKYEELLKQKALEKDRIREEKAAALLSSNSSSSSRFIKKDSYADSNGGKTYKNKTSSMENSGTNGFLKARAGKLKTSSRESTPVQAVSIAKTENFSWDPAKVPSSSPISQQIEIVKGYLAQAKKAGKKEEVKLFEENLRGLLELNREVASHPS